MKKDKRLMEASLWERLWGSLGLVLMGGAMLSKSLIQFSVEVLGLSSLLFDLRPNYGGGNEGNVTSFKMFLAHTATLSATNPAAGHCCHMPLPDSWTLKGKSGSVSCGVTVPFSCVLVYTSFCLCPPRVCFPSPV